MIVRDIDQRVGYETYGIERRSRLTDKAITGDTYRQVVAVGCSVATFELSLRMLVGDKLHLVRIGITKERDLLKVSGIVPSDNDTIATSLGGSRHRVYSIAPVSALLDEIRLA